MLKILGVAVASLAILGGTCLVANDADAGASPFKLDRESYRPGEVAVASAPFGPGCCNRGWIEDGPYFAFIQHVVDGRATGEQVPVGDVRIEEEEYVANGQTFKRYVARVEFVVPDLPYGQYVLNHCNEGCAMELGELIGGWFSIGPVSSDQVRAQPTFTG